jgi:gamma-glutamyltranspeptidase/glutathione hydrolase
MAVRARPGLRPAVAAGHPATAEAGLEILADGGTAADAAVAAALASCVAETVMTGLLGGAHALVWDGARALNLDCFVAVPGGAGAPMLDLQVPFGEETVHYAVGPASCAVPGLPAGLDALWRSYGRLPWPRLVEPALRLAREGTELPGRHAACLAMLEPVMTLNRGAALYSPGGRLLGPGERLRACPGRQAPVL